MKPDKQIDIHLTLEQLEAIEYAGVLSWSYEESGCPVCATNENSAHLPQCWIGNAIQRLKTKQGRKP